MFDRHILRDRTLVLRIMDERLQSRLREKMSAIENTSTTPTNNLNKIKSQHFGLNSAAMTGSNNAGSLDGRILDLEGVTCEPAIQSSVSVSSPASSQVPGERDDAHTLWNFHVDGATYPARLTNLPCPIELHKTHDHIMYYKCVNVAQMLIVYGDLTALEEAESTNGYKVDGFPSYYHSGLTPPMDKVVARRYKQREHNMSAPPPVEEVNEVENSLLELIKSISSKDPTKKVGRGNTSISTKLLEEVEDEIVDYEPWMDNNGNTPEGIQFSEKDALCKMHPELWLQPKEDTIDNPGKIEDNVKKTIRSSSDTNKASSKNIKSEKKAKKKKSNSKKKIIEDNVPRPSSVSPVPRPPDAPDSATTDINAIENFDIIDIDNFDVDLGFTDLDLDELELE